MFRRVTLNVRSGGDVEGELWTGCVCKLSDLASDLLAPADISEYMKTPHRPRRCGHEPS